jgi:MoxR-like ATPase
VANLPKGLLTGSDPAITSGAYGPDLSIYANGQIVLRDASNRSIAVWANGGYHVSVDDLNPKTVPYVNAFVRDHGTIDKYWRTKAYRFNPVTGVKVASNELDRIWDTSGTPLASTNPPFVTPATAVPVTPAPVAIPATPAMAAKAAAPVAPEPAPVEPAPAAPAPVVPAPLPPKRTAKKRGSTLKAPDGYVVIQGRNGEDLVIPERVVATFHAAVKSRFEAGLPAHPIAIGPAGTGKTESVIALAISEGMEIAGVIQCGGVEGPADLYGQTTPDETAPHGWRRMPSALWKAFDTALRNPDKTYCTILDEVNRVGTLAAQNSLLGALDGTACLQNPATGEVIPLPPNMFVVATANIGIAYSGTIRMDAALMSRWWTNLVFGYLPENVERAIAVAIMGNDEQARYLARAARELRNAHGQEEFRSALVPGTREIVAVAQQARFDPAGVAGAWHDKITCSFSDDGRDKARTEHARVRVISESVFKSEAPVDERPSEDEDDA